MEKKVSDKKEKVRFLKRRHFYYWVLFYLGGAMTKINTEWFVTAFGGLIVFTVIKRLLKYWKKPEAEKKLYYIITMIIAMIILTGIVCVFSYYTFDCIEKWFNGTHFTI